MNKKRRRLKEKGELDEDWRKFKKGQARPKAPRWPLWSHANPMGAPPGSKSSTSLRSIHNYQVQNTDLLQIDSASTPECAFSRVSSIDSSNGFSFYACAPRNTNMRQNKPIYSGQIRMQKQLSCWYPITSFSYRCVYMCIFHVVIMHDKGNNTKEKGEHRVSRSD